MELKKEITFRVHCEGLDEAVAKAERLRDLLREAEHIVRTMAGQDLRMVTFTREEYEEMQRREEVSE